MAEPSGVVWLGDPEPGRRAAVREALAAAGVDVTDVTSLPDRPAGHEDSPALLVVLACTDLSAIGGLLDAARRLGAGVIGYAGGLDQWPVSRKAALLVRGVRLLLDSAGSGFPDRLVREVVSALRRGADHAGTARRVTQVLHEAGLVGRSRALRRAGEWLLRVAPLSSVPVLITGETGTGKELVARAVHARDPRRSGAPFVAVNCAALTASLAESELFGHRRGAFTGAERERAGLAGAARGGVLFLDEIGELDLALQAKLLRLLQERRIQRVGDDRETEVDLRVIAATNRDLPAAVSAGRFRLDLYHRLNVLPIHLPPLRERREDIPALVRHLLTAMATPAAPPPVEPDLLEALAELPLPGNVRQLENLLRHALAQAEPDGPIRLADLPPELVAELGSRVPIAAPDLTLPPVGLQLDQVAAAASEGRLTLDQALVSCERVILEATLRRTRHNQSQAARLLGITPRSVYNKLRRLGLNA